MESLRRPLLLGVFLLVAAGLQVVTPQRASGSTTYRIQVGGWLSFPTVESTRIYPPTIRVHQGDVLRFTSSTWNTATILTKDQDPDAWLDANWGPGDPWSLYSNDEDDAATNLSPRFAAASFACGWPWQSPCPVAGLGDPVTDVVHSGLPLFYSEDAGAIQQYQLDFSIVIEADVGTKLWALSLVHPGARMQIEVVDVSQPATTRAAIKKQTATLKEKDRALAEKLHQSALGFHPTSVIDGTKTHDVKVGVEGKSVFIRRFYPSTVRVKPGEDVRWRFDHLKWRSETVSFPFASGLGAAAGFAALECDPGTGAETTAAPEPPLCPDGSLLESELPSQLFTPAGDGIVDSKTDVENSALRGGAAVDNADDYVLRFPTASGKAGFSYIGIMHAVTKGPMTGKVVVGR